MKAVAHRSELAAALSAIGPAIPTRPQVPSLAAVKLEVNGSLLTLMGTDAETVTIVREIGVRDASNGSAYVSGHRLRDLVSKLSGTTVELAEVSDVDGLAVKSGHSSYVLSQMDSTAFPGTPKLPPKIGEAAADSLNYAMRAVSHAGKSELEGMVGIFVETLDGDLWIAALDGYQLGASPMSWEGGDVDARLLSSPLITKNISGRFSLHLDSNNIAFVCDDATVITRLIALEKKANWKAIRSLNPEMLVIADVAALLSALERAALTLDEHGNVRIDIADESLAMTGAGQAGSGGERVDVVGQGAAGFHVQPKRFIPILQLISEPSVEIGVSTRPGMPIRLRGVTKDRPSRTTHLLQPVTVK